MVVPDVDQLFAASIPQLHERYFVPLIFEPYAVDLASRMALRTPFAVLEIAAGTGVVTRQLASTLAPSVPIVATDLNQAMLDLAASSGTIPPTEWRQADAAQLPFPDILSTSLSVISALCSSRKKTNAFSEARRVLRAGGVFIFNLWDRIEQNELPTPLRPHWSKYSR